MSRRTAAVWQPAYVGLGSNLQDPRAQIRRACAGLQALAFTRLVRVSPLYRSRPWGPVPQPDFINAVAGLLTQVDARTLLGELQALERALGRPAEHERWGPRIIDLDLLVYGRERREEPGLTLPHRGIVERNFVLYPLADLAPELDVPGLGRVAGLRGRVASEGLEPLGEP
ncbi:MAG TPA: 2-amino-4-hydroxy-6-hydroxymethyldihydropteridine diphosphokinase [Steroidobacteraceae bacterium]|nr:2-amino-4-hydroxy-6-hydroxymethyldihydropteridine diphosphokinase [Steroidobacteraceae bacterium]